MVRSAIHPGEPLAEQKWGDTIEGLPTLAESSGKMEHDSQSEHM